MTAAVQRLVQVRLHGHLAARFGRVHELAVDSAAEAVQALTVLCKGFAEAVRGFGGPGYRVRVGEGRAAAWRDEATLALGLGRARRVDIVPVLHGRKRNGVGQIIVGVVLLVAAYFGYGNEYSVNLGISLILGGAIALLTPMPKGSGSKAAEEVSKQINGPVNVISAGGPVPIIIGRMLVGSVTVSAGLSTDAAPITSSTPAGPELPPEEPHDWADWESPGGGGGDA